MLVLLIGLLCWTQTEGSCCEPIVNIIPVDVTLSVGQSFSLSCEFMCLTTQHAQLWKDKSKQDVLLINMSVTYPNVSLVLHILSATEVDAGNYSCRTHPPDTISPFLEIKIAENLKTIRSFQPTSSQAPSTAGESSGPSGTTSQKGLIGQVWYWMLLGKTATLLLSLITLAVKYKSG